LNSSHVTPTSSKVTIEIIVSTAHLRRKVRRRNLVQCV
jgi:hypothetical protein